MTGQRQLAQLRDQTETPDCGIDQERKLHRGAGGEFLNLMQCCARSADQYLRKLTQYRCGGLWELVLAVVLLSINVAACTIQLTIQATTLAVAEMAIRSRESLVYPYSRLLGFKSFGLASSQLTVTNPFSNAHLLIVLAPVYPFCAGERNRTGRQRDQD